MSYLDDYYAKNPNPGQEFGAARDGGARRHQGADFSHSRTPGTIGVPAVASGRVTGNYWTDGYGWRLVIGPWSYSHLQWCSPLPVGAWVNAGDIVGNEGTTGWTDGPCCHVEYVQGGRTVDPVPIIRSILSAAPAALTATAARRQEENPDMPVFIEPNIISWPNGYTNSYDRNVYLTCQWVANRQITEAWAVNRFVDESWKAARELRRILESEEPPPAPVEISPISQDELAKRVAAVLAG